MDLVRSWYGLDPKEVQTGFFNRYCLITNPLLFNVKRGKKYYRNQFCKSGIILFL